MDNRLCGVGWAFICVTNLQSVSDHLFLAHYFPLWSRFPLRDLSTDLHKSIVRIIRLKYEMNDATRQQKLSDLTSRLFFSECAGENAKKSLLFITLPSSGHLIKTTCAFLAQWVVVRTVMLSHLGFLLSMCIPLMSFRNQDTGNDRDNPRSCRVGHS